MKGFYTAKEAQKKLGINPDQFQYLVRKGTIKRVILPGRKYGVYPESDVNQLVAAINATIEQYSKRESTFECASEADLPEIYVLIRRTHRRAPSLEHLEEWMRHNPEIFYALRNKGILVGYACILPINQTWLKRAILNRKHYVTLSLIDIPLSAIRTSQKLTTASDFLIDFEVIKGNRKETAHYAQRLLLEIGHTLKRFEARGANIKALYALPLFWVEDFCRKIGFAWVVPSTKKGGVTALDQFDPRVYRLDVANATRHIVRHFREETENHEARIEKIQAGNSTEQQRDQ